MSSIPHRSQPIRHKTNLRHSKTFSMCSLNTKIIFMALCYGSNIKKNLQSYGKYHVAPFSGVCGSGFTVHSHLYYGGHCLHCNSHTWNHFFVRKEMA